MFVRGLSISHRWTAGPLLLLLLPLRLLLLLQMTVVRWSPSGDLLGSVDDEFTVKVRLWACGPDPALGSRARTQAPGSMGQGPEPTA
jgi:hypothetical protein